MTGAEVVRIVAYLEEAGIRIWLDGGWGSMRLSAKRRVHIATSMRLSSWSRRMLPSLLSLLSGFESNGMTGQLA